MDKPVKSGGAPTTKLLRANSMKQFDSVYTEKSPLSVLNFKPVFNSKDNPRLHPTQKPVDLLEYLIKTYTRVDGVVLDNCMGSGFTGVACINIDRKFIGVEKDADYFQVAKKRLTKVKSVRNSRLF